MTGSNVSPYSSTASAKEMAAKLPFKIGQEVETKSFDAGFRGAWFDCKIMDIDKGARNHLRYRLRYIHFPEEALHWCQAYQLRHRGQVDSRQLMLRPKPPPTLREDDLPFATYNGIVVVPHVWEVGDLVDWWRDDCWWGGAVSEILGPGKLKVALLKPPLGEGKVYSANAVELRPSLCWSPADQWTLPISRTYKLTPVLYKNSSGVPAARIVELSSNRSLRPPVQPAGLMSVDKEFATQGNSSPKDQNGAALNQLSRQVMQGNSATPLHPVKEEPDQKCLTGPRTIPCLDVLRAAAEALGNGIRPQEGNNADWYPQSRSTNERFQHEPCTSSGTSDDDLEYLADALHRKWHRSMIRYRKFKRYRKQVNRAIGFMRKRFKKHIFAKSKILDYEQSVVLYRGHDEQVQ